MKKTSKLFGAVALSAALALGCAVPAFAEDIPAPSVSDQTTEGGNGFKVGNPDDPNDTDKTKGKATTNVNVATHITQISATIPLNMVIDADLNGGPALTPSAGSYGITNESTCVLYVKSISADSSDDNKWKFITTKPADNTIPDRNGTVGDIYMTVQPGTWNDAETDESKKFTVMKKNETPGAADVEAVIVTSDSPQVAAGEWRIPATGTMALKTEAITSVLNDIGIVSGANGLSSTSVKALTITYTIGITAA